MDAPHSGRTRHRQCVRLRAVRRHGGVLARDLLGDRLGRHSGNAQTRLFGRLPRRNHRRGRHAPHPAAALNHPAPLPPPPPTNPPPPPPSPPPPPPAPG